jgi:uncharacterized cupredoxin-like copper-binding protein
MFTNPITPMTAASSGRVRSAFGALVASVGLVALATACADNGTSAPVGDRPSVTFTANDTTLTAPAEVPSGFVDVHIHSTGTIGHHLLFARLNDGVTFDEFQAADSEEGSDAFFTMLTIHGGNGTVAPGADVSLTLDLRPGNYFALDNPQNASSPTATFTVVADHANGSEPKAKGIVTLGPGMSINVPDDFDAKGTWEFVNKDDNEVHEAALVKLAAGASVADVVQWAQTFEGAPPFDGEFGSMGAVGPGQRAWITIAPGTPGEYALICFVPGRDGKPHVMKGMARQVTVRS